MKLIVSELMPYENADEQATTQANGKAGNVDNTVKRSFQESAETDFDVIVYHVILMGLVCFY